MSSRSSFPRLCALALLALAAPVSALETRCVNTVTEFRNALLAADDDDMQIKVVRGDYSFSSDPMDSAPEPSLGYNVTITGGYNADCSTRQYDPLLTVFTGSAPTFTVASYDSVVISSIAFIDFGQLAFAAASYGGNGPDERVTLSRVWFENLCGNGNCSGGGARVSVNADDVTLSQITAIGQPGTRCALEIETYDLNLATIAFSLFTGNGGDGLCLTRTENVDDFSFYALNNVFWDNAGDDIVTRVSSDLRLYNNLYQSLDTSPAPANAPVGTISVDPQFVNAGAGNYHLQNDSPAVNTGLLVPPSLPTRDIEGGTRWIGPAPDRGPYESPSADDSILLVTNTSDSIASPATGSLRWAINQANADSGFNRIRFAIGGSCPRIVHLAGPLPDITDLVSIEGYTQPGSEAGNSSLIFDATICIGIVGDYSANHALQMPISVGSSEYLNVSGIGFGGYNVAAIRLAGGASSHIHGNQFGGELDGFSLGNSAVNVRIGGTSRNNLVGGDEPAQRNLIMFAWNAGIELLDNSGGAEGYGNRATNNFIGTSASGGAMAANNLGVRVRTHENVIEDNVISGNQTHGVLLEGPLANDNRITSNRIGLKSFALCFPPPCDPQDYALGNIQMGVLVEGGGSDNHIQFNEVAHNGQKGIRLFDGLRNRLLANSVHHNASLGIDVGVAGVNPEYPGGGSDQLANHGINAPTLAAARGGQHAGRLTGLVETTSGTYIMEAFSSASCDASGYGEGQTQVGAKIVEIPGPPGSGGTAQFEMSFASAGNLQPRFITTTWFDLDGNSSEFSNCVPYQCDTIFAHGFDSASAESCPLP
jgi:hypothetical protein